MDTTETLQAITTRECIGYAGKHRKVIPAGTEVTISFIGQLVKINAGATGRIVARVPASYVACP